MLQSIQQLVADRYAVAHGARLTVDFPHYCTIQDENGPCATLGFRSAADGPLFLERYLSQPIEQVIADVLGRTLSRERIVEIGAHASQRPRATVALWARAAAELGRRGELAVAVLTAPMRAMFERLGLPITVLAAADPAMLGEDGRGWGRYYHTEPMVCAGEIAAAQPALARWQSLDAQ